MRIPPVCKTCALIADLVRIFYAHLTNAHLVRIYIYMRILVHKMCQNFLDLFIFLSLSLSSSLQNKNIIHERINRGNWRYLRRVDRIFFIAEEIGTKLPYTVKIGWVLLDTQ